MGTGDSVDPERVWTGNEVTQAQQLISRLAARVTIGEVKVELLGKNVQDATPIVGQHDQGRIFEIVHWGDLRQSGGNDFHLILPLNAIGGWGSSIQAALGSLSVDLLEMLQLCAFDEVVLVQRHLVEMDPDWNDTNWVALRTTITFRGALPEGCA